MNGAAVVVALSGPMTGIPKYNYPAFHEAERKLKILGCKVYSPARNEIIEGKPWGSYVGDYLDVLRKVHEEHGEHVLMGLLKGHQKSDGSAAEKGLARHYGWDLIELDEEA